MATAGAKVTVASKLPMSFEMQCCTKRTVQMKNGNTAWVEDQWTKSGKVVVINGTAYPNGQLPEGMPDRPQMANGSALTFGVDKDFFDAWMEQNKDTSMVKNHLIFAATTTEGVKAKAREFKDIQSGLQALTPDNDRRMPKKLVTGHLAKGEAEAAVAE
jgi:hypothetical protein